MNLKDSQYFPAAQLMLSILPDVMKHKCFALKGGTALNFFYRDMPRLSVDIDLTYVPLDDRETALARMKKAMDAIAATLSRRGLRIHKQRLKLVVSNTETSVKIEPNEILRGTVFPPQSRRLSAEARRLFQVDMKVACLSFADLYAGKFCAALDRQHPRDLFDVKLLFDNEGITEDLQIAFLVYLISHNRPMNELLDPNMADITAVYTQEFAEMPEKTVPLRQLEEVRNKLVRLLKKSLNDNYKTFLLSMKEGNPTWDLLPVAHAKDLPAVKWKLININKLKGAKRRAAIAKLHSLLFGK